MIGEVIYVKQNDKEGKMETSVTGKEISMIRKLSCAIIVVLLMVFAVPLAYGAELSPKYLHGRWVIDAKNCSSSEDEYMLFRENGTFEDARGGKAEIVGFWQISGYLKSAVLLHVVTSPAFFHDIMPALKQHQGTFDYFQATIFAFNLGQDSFEGLGILGAQQKRMAAVRCK